MTTIDYLELGRKADQDDKDAISVLENAGSALKMDLEDFDTWTEVAKAVVRKTLKGNYSEAEEKNPTLAERGKTHGDYRDVARISQLLRGTMVQGKNWDSLNAVQRESLEMIVHKMARILSGDNNHLDHWHDIAGYALLVEEELKHADERAPLK